MLSLGLAAVKPGLKFSALPNEGTDFTQAFVQADGRQVMRTQSKPALRLGLGFQTQLTEGVGIRALWRYELLRELKIEGGAADQIDLKPFDKAHSLAVGLFVKF